MLLFYSVQAHGEAILFSTASGVFPGARPVLLLTLKICVSTAIVGFPKASFKTTLAVLRPTPGRASNASCPVEQPHHADQSEFLTRPTRF